MDVIVKTSNASYYNRLVACVLLLENAMQGIEKHYKIKLPARIVLRPLRKYKVEKCMNLTLGLAGYKPGQGYWIALNLRVFDAEASQYFLDLLAHEAAHIGEALKTKQWSHSKLFDEMHEVARQKAIRKKT